MPLVSIVVANYNYGRFLGEAIESALAQTHAHTEVVVVDDGSTDDSAEVASRYPVTFVKQQNAGVCAARNRGVAEAKGTLLVFLDADDVLEKEFVAKCWTALSASGPEVAYAYTQVQLFGTETGLERSRPFSATALAKGNFVAATALVRRHVFEQIGQFDVTWTRGYEDYELWLRMLDHGFGGVLVPEPLLRYRRHGPSRNVLSDQELLDLRNRLLATYPRLHWKQLVTSPVRSLRALSRYRWGRR